MKGDMYIARSWDKDITEQAECGGAVTSLLRFALESNRADAVLATEARGGDRYDGVPVLITNPDDVIKTAGSLHCASPNIAWMIKEYLEGAFDQKIAVVVKPCDARGILELAKRYQIDRENLLLIGVNCTGTLPPEKAKQMLKEEFGVDPSEVAAEDIEDGKLFITLKDGSEKEKSLAELEEKGFGRRDNCRRCDINIPVMADIACGKWGTTDKNTTFVEVCSDKGAEFIDAAIGDGYIQTEGADKNAIDARKKKDEDAIEAARQCQENDWAPFREMSTEERYSYWFDQFGHCIKCFGCRDACPICYCKDCILEADRDVVAAGEVPPNVLWPMIRITHVMDSCVNCGQCQDACPMEIPLAKLIFMLSKELDTVFKHEPGMDVESMPPLRTATDKELSMETTELTL
ncbi:MAG: Coenzyme F420 hydrogenase/dehydrogenase, beta subunit C-terminal domain [Chloroflexota bacterium]